MPKKPAVTKMKSGDLLADVRELTLAERKKISGVGQLLSVSAVHGALMRSETIAVPSKMNGSGNAGGITRRSLFQWMGLFGLFARFFGKEKVQANPTGGAEEIPDPEWLVKWRAANRKPIWESCDPRIQAIIRAIRLNQDVSIRYFGGNSPGEPRVIVPSLAFQCDGFSGTWVSAYCRTRGQHRTFRSDQIELS